MPVFAAPLEAMAVLGFVLAGLPVYYFTKQDGNGQRMTPSGQLINGVFNLTEVLTFDCNTEWFGACWGRIRGRAPGAGWGRLRSDDAQEELLHAPS